MPRTKIQNEQIRIQKRAQILESALELFAQDGYHTTTIADIAKHAGIAKGLTYSYFQSKEDLLHAILVEGFSRLLQDIDANHDGILTSEEMFFYINSVFQIMEREEHYWKLYFSIALQPDVLNDSIREDIMQMSQPFFKILEKYFVLKGFENPMAEMIFFHSLLDGIFFNYIFNEEYPLNLMKEMVVKRYV